MLSKKRQGNLAAVATPAPTSTAAEAEVTAAAATATETRGRDPTRVGGGSNGSKSTDGSSDNKRQ